MRFCVQLLKHGARTAFDSKHIENKTIQTQGDIIVSQDKVQQGCVRQITADVVSKKLRRKERIIEVRFFFTQQVVNMHVRCERIQSGEAYYHQQDCALSNSSSWKRSIRALGMQLDEWFQED